MGPDGLNRVGQASKLPNSAEKVLKLAEKQAETRAETRQITAEKVRFFKVSRVKKSNFSSKTFKFVDTLVVASAKVLPDRVTGFEQGTAS